MKSILSFLFVMVLTVPVMAETIALKDGRSVVGVIMERNDDSVTVSVDGLTTTLYNDEIVSIDGVTMAKPVPVAVSAVSTISPERKALILSFIDAFGTRTAMKENLDLMFNSMPADDPQAKELKEKVSIDEIIERLIPLYEASFSDEELKAAIDFYTSPAGKKLLQEIPQIMEGSVEVTAQYFDEKFPQFNEKNSDVNP